MMKRSVPVGGVHPVVLHNHGCIYCWRGACSVAVSVLQEATVAVKKLLGPYYLRDETPIFQALYESWTSCKYVDDTGSYLHFKSK